MQAKLLRVLEEGEVERIGGDRRCTVNVRVVVATHRNLEDWSSRACSGRTFIIAFMFSRSRCRRCASARKISRAGGALRRGRLPNRTAGKPTRSSRRPSKSCRRYPWPGNVRELRNVVERLLLLAEGDTVTAATVQAALPAQAAAAEAFGLTGTGTLAERVEQFERQVILDEIKRHNHHITNTAKALGLERSHLYKKCQQTGDRSASDA